MFKLEHFSFHYSLGYPTCLIAYLQMDNNYKATCFKMWEKSSLYEVISTNTGLIFAIIYSWQLTVSILLPYIIL